MESKIDSEFLEKLIIKSMMVDKKILTLVCSVFEPEYFDDSSVKYVFEYYKKHLDEFYQIAPTEAIINSTDDKVNIKEFFNDVNSIEYNIAENQDHLLTEINFYLKDKALKKAMLDGVDIIDKGGDVNLLREKIESALCKDIKIDLGLNYFKDLGKRLKKIFTTTDYRLPSYFPQFDEYINGGFPPFTLSVLVAKIHGWKCLTYNTEITIKNNNKIENIKIGDFFKKNINTCSDESYLQGEIKMKQKGVKKIDLFINKYGEEKGIKRYNIWLENNRSAQKKKKGINTLKWCIEKYGEKKGTKKYEESSIKRSISAQGINTLEYYIKKYKEKEGTKKYKEKNNKISDPGRCTLPYFINKYGDINGEKKHDQYIKLQRYSHSEKGYIDKYGEKEGTKKWQERVFYLKHLTSLDGFISRHGKIEGTKRWKQKTKRWLKSYKKSNFSKISQELFWNIIKNVDDLSNIYFAELDENKKKDISGKNHEYNIDLGNRFIKPDFFIKNNKKIIEFDGDYWHGKVRGNIERDKQRDISIINKGYKILHIKERDYNYDKDVIIKECLEFIKL